MMFFWKFIKVKLSIWRRTKIPWSLSILIPTKSFANLAKLVFLAPVPKVRDFRIVTTLSLTFGRPSIPLEGCDLCLTGDSQCSSFHKRCEKNENGDFCQTSASCGEGFGFTNEDKCGACLPLIECLGCPDHSIGTCDCEKCSGGSNDVFGIRADSECSVAPDGDCAIEYGHCQGNDTSVTASPNSPI